MRGGVVCSEMSSRSASVVDNSVSVFRNETMKIDRDDTTHRDDTVSIFRFSVGGGEAVDAHNYPGAGWGVQ